MDTAPVTTPENDVVLVRDDNGRFVPGTRPPPGKAGRVGGRAKALLLLDRRTMPADVFRQECEAEFLEDSAGVFRNVDDGLMTPPASGIRSTTTSGTSCPGLSRSS